MAGKIDLKSAAEKEFITSLLEREPELLFPTEDNASLKVKLDELESRLSKCCQEKAKLKSMLEKESKANEKPFSVEELERLLKELKFQPDQNKSAQKVFKRDFANGIGAKSVLDSLVDVTLPGSHRPDTSESHAKYKQYAEDDQGYSSRGALSSSSAANKNISREKDRSRTSEKQTKHSDRDDEGIDSWKSEKPVKPETSQGSIRSRSGGRSPSSGAKNKESSRKKKKSSTDLSSSFQTVSQESLGGDSLQNATKIDSPQKLRNGKYDQSKRPPSRKSRSPPRKDSNSSTATNQGSVESKKASERRNQKSSGRKKPDPESESEDDNRTHTLEISGSEAEISGDESEEVGRKEQESARRMNSTLEPEEIFISDEGERLLVVNRNKGKENNSFVLPEHLDSEESVDRRSSARKIAADGASRKSSGRQKSAQNDDDSERQLKKSEKKRKSLEDKSARKSDKNLSKRSREKLSERDSSTAIIANKSKERKKSATTSPSSMRNMSSKESKKDNASQSDRKARKDSPHSKAQMKNKTEEESEDSESEDETSTTTTARGKRDDAIATTNSEEGSEDETVTQASDTGSESETESEKSMSNHSAKSATSSEAKKRKNGKNSGIKADSAKSATKKEFKNVSKESESSHVSKSEARGVGKSKKSEPQSARSETIAPSDSEEEPEKYAGNAQEEPKKYASDAENDPDLSVVTPTSSTSIGRRLQFQDGTKFDENTKKFRKTARKEIEISPKGPDCSTVVQTPVLDKKGQLISAPCDTWESMDFTRESAKAYLKSSPSGNPVHISNDKPDPKKKLFTPTQQAAASSKSKSTTGRPISSSPASRSSRRLVGRSESNERLTGRDNPYSGGRTTGGQSTGYSGARSRKEMGTDRNDEFGTKSGPVSRSTSYISTADGAVATSSSFDRSEMEALRRDFNRQITHLQDQLAEARRRERDYKSEYEKCR